jgi:hypothetical protein
MKKKIIVSLMVLFTIMFSINTVRAGISNINIALPSNFTILNTKNSDTSSYYEENQIYLHAINDEENESIIIAKLESDFTTQVANLKDLSEENFEAFMQQYKDSKEQENVTILKQEKFEYNNFLFVDTIFEQTTNENSVQTEEYYTIIDSSAVIISISFLNKEIDTQVVNQVINSITFVDEESENSLFTNTWIVLAIFLVLVGIYFIKEKKYKLQLEESDKKRVLNQVIQYIKKDDYQKFKGVLKLFAFTLALNIINLLYGTIKIIKQNNEAMQLGLANKIYVFLLIVQNVIQLLCLIYISYRLMKKESKTIEYIKKTFIILAICICALAIVRTIMQGVFIKNSDIVTYFKEEAETLLNSLIDIGIWYFYFKNSIRVSVCYNEKSIEQIILEPKKGYQERKVAKKVMEVKIIEYLKSQKAFDYTSGIYINKMPKEYANSLSLSDLTSKKIVKLKRAKYYLNKKYL